MILLLHGGDALSIRRSLQRIKEDADGGSGMLLTNLAEIDGRDAKPADILGPAMSPPFLAPKRLILVEHLLDRFNGSSDGRPPRSVEPWNPLFRGLEAGLPESTVLVFTGGEQEQRNGLLRALAKIDGVINEEHAKLKPKDAARYVRDEAAARGVRLRSGPSRVSHFDSEQWVAEASSDPAALLGILTQADTLRIANELDKLALYSQGRDVTVDDIYEVCAGEREATSFQFTDAVMDGQHVRALETLHLLMRDGESVAGLLGLLTSSYRTLATVIDLLESGATPEAIGQAIRRPWPGLRDAAIRRARRLGQPGIEAAYEALLDAERRWKLGEISEELAIELLIARLVRLRPAAERGA